MESRAQCEDHAINWLSPAYSHFIARWTWDKMKLSKLVLNKFERWRRWYHSRLAAQSFGKALEISASQQSLLRTWSRSINARLPIGWSLSATLIYSRWPFGGGSTAREIYGSEKLPFSPRFNNSVAIKPSARKLSVRHEKSPLPRRTLLFLSKADRRCGWCEYSSRYGNDAFPSLDFRC